MVTFNPAVHSFNSHGHNTVIALSAWYSTNRKYFPYCRRKEVLFGEELISVFHVFHCCHLYLEHFHIT